MEIFETEIMDAFRVKLENAQKISIIGHKNVDADCLGASMALQRFFTKKNVETKIIIPDEIPAFLNWLPYKDFTFVYNHSQNEVRSFLNESDFIFMVDFSNLRRIGDLEGVVEKIKVVKINIDHHREPQNIADFSFVEPERSSASELVFDFLKKIDKVNIDKQIAEYVFMGITSDTGNFAYSSAGSKTFSVASELLSFDIDKTKIINGLYNNHSYNRMKLMGYILANKMFYKSEKHFAYMVLSLEDQKKFEYKPGDHENFVNFPLSISDVNFAVLMFEQEDTVKISLRSIGNLNVNKISKKYFDGGGHLNAAGGRSDQNLEDTIAFFENNIDQILEIGYS